MTTFVFGHKAPDTDSAGSALIWAWYLSEHRDHPAEARLLGTPSTEAAFVMDRWGFATPAIIDDVASGQSCVIVDTNNPTELPASINGADVIQIIDHHKLAGGLETKGPIDITIKPLACTATILHNLMGENAAKMPEGIKGLMLSCILSDTLAFRSPTTTDQDKALAETLARDLGLSIDTYADALFAAKSDVSAFSAAELLRMDSKVYEAGGTKYRVSVLESTKPEIVLDRKAEIMETMPAIASEDGVDQVLLFVIDILNEQAIFLVPNDAAKTVAESNFGGTVDGDTAVLPGIMSRKKQIIPALG